MYKYILDSVNQIDWLALVPLLIFFTFFTLVSIRAIRHKKTFIAKMEQLPLED